MFGSGNVVTGLDVGVGSVKVARLAHRGDGVDLVGLSIAEIDGDTAGEPQENPSRRSATIAAIHKAFATLGTAPAKAGRVVSSIGGPNVSVKQLVFPKMARQTFAESVQYEARRHVPFDPTDVVLDFQLLEHSDHDKDGQMRVLLGAAKRSVINRHIDILAEVGIEPQLVDLEPLALLNEADAEGLVNSGAVAVIEIGDAAANIAAFRRGRFFFARSIPLRAGLGTDPGDKTWFRLLIEEVKVSLSYFDNQAGKEGIETLCVCGGRALQDGMVEVFHEALGVATKALNPLAQLTEASIDVGELGKQGPRFALAFGLARRRR